MRNQNELTRGEEEIMQILWRLGNGTINDVIELMAEPKPKYTTVATFFKILENKGFIAREARGRQSPAFLRNSNGRLDLPGPTQEAA